EQPENRGHSRVLLY
nr:immunoglobulin heavy chain junction region [Homo sapiens]